MTNPELTEAERRLHLFLHKNYHIGNGDLDQTGLLVDLMSLCDRFNVDFRVSLADAERILMNREVNENLPDTLNELGGEE